MSLNSVSLLSNSNYQLVFKRVVLLFLTVICVQACSKQERREGPTKSDTAQVSENLTKEISEGPAKRIVELFYDYRGKLDLRKIGMMIGATKKGVVSGHYFYYDELKDIEFTGQLLNGEEARLVEKDTLGNEVATFKLFFLKEDSVKGNQIVGIRISKNGVTDSVYLQGEGIVTSLSAKLKVNYNELLAAGKN